MVSHYSIQGVFPNGIAPANPADGSGIIGHSQVPDADNPSLGGGMNHHTDPTSWDWPHYEALFANAGFIVEAKRAIQLVVPTRESYQYQIFSSTDLTNWAPVSEILTACAGDEVFHFPATNANENFRAQEWPPDLSKRIPGLTNVFLDTARTTSQSNRVTIAGMRVQSRDYNFNDYVIGTYELDLCKQFLSIRHLEVLTNVGLTCGTTPMFFLKDATNAVYMTNGTIVYGAETNFTLVSTGQDLLIPLRAAQSLRFHFSTAGPSSEFQYLALDPLGNEIESHILPAACAGCVLGSIDALRSGLYTIRFIPRNAPSVSILLSFINANRRPSLPLINGQLISLLNYAEDYERFQITLRAGQTLRISGSEPGVGETVCNSLGVVLADVRPGTLPVIFIPPLDDTYSVIFHSSDWSAHSFRINVDTTP